MPSPSAARHRGPVVRQLSLQSQPNAQPPAGRRALRKQLSEDDGRSRTLDSVEVTGHGWSINGGDKSEGGLRVGLNETAKYGQSKVVTVTRPRPVKLAWADRKQDATDGPTDVEVVARKCQGQPRPVTVKAPRTANLGLPSEKDTLVYSRQQLAERLRMAWREREKNKPNLSIFLAHAAEGVRSGGEEPDTGRSSGIHRAEILIQDSVTFRSVSASESSFSSDAGRVNGALGVDIVSNGPCVRFAGENIPPARNGIESEPKSILKNVRSQPKQTENSASDLGKLPKQSVTESPEFKTFPVGDSSNKFGNNLTNLEYRMKSPDSSGKVAGEKDKENNSPRSDSGYSEHSKIEGSEACEVRPHGTAQERRASFRRGSLLNKAIDESSSPPGADSSDEAEDEVAHEPRSEIKVFLKKNEKRPPMLRTFSAPTRNDSPKPAPAPANTGLGYGCKSTSQFASSVDLVGTDEDAVALRGRIKSAPIRRKLKTAAARRKYRGGKEPDSSDDEKPSLDSSKKKVSRRKVSSKSNAADIVTMVSLVSPATTDTEESAMALPEESWTGEDVEEKAKAEEDGESEPPKEVSSFVIQKFVSLRKTNKTVSFVQHPPINRSYSASFPSRRAPAGTPIIIPTPIVTNPALTPAQLQEREKRPQPPSPGNPAATDTRGIKRRLVRTASAPQVKESLWFWTTARGQDAVGGPLPRALPPRPACDEGMRLLGKVPLHHVLDNEFREGSRPGRACTLISRFVLDVNSRRNEESVPGAKAEGELGDPRRKNFDKIEESKDEESEEKKEPEFKSPKERECWMLYQKMLEKGVSVSFDTVLRGMLTPTEYRLRRNQLLSSC